MFGIGMPELIIIVIVALIVVGPRKLPDLAKTLGKGMQEFRKATDEIKNEFSEHEAMQDFKDIKSSVDSIKGTVSSMHPKGLLDMDATLEPKKPEENRQARDQLMQEAAQEAQAAAEGASEKASPPDETASTEASDSTPTPADASATKNDA